MIKFQDCPTCKGREYHWINDRHRCVEHDRCVECGIRRIDLDDVPWGHEKGFICKKCNKIKCQKYIDDFQATEPDDFEFKYKDHIKCPYCGHVNDSGETHEDDEDFECGQCESRFIVEVEISIEYSTFKKD